MDDADGSDDDQKVPQSSPPEYRSLITIRAGKPNGDIGEALIVDPDKVRRLSLSETELAKAAISLGADLLRYIFHDLLRRSFIFDQASFSLEVKKKDKIIWFLYMEYVSYKDVIGHAS